MKKILISPYFGKLPNYFQIFLDSCGLNEDFCDFLIITDDKTLFNVPKNVKMVLMTFEAFNSLTKQKLGDEFGISSPYKICDYRPAFGKIFDKYIDGYDFWGHVDTDMVLGKLSNFLFEETFEKYDRILERGALMFYRNMDDINELFRQNVGGVINFNEAVAMHEPCFYDEIMFPVLLLKAGYTTYSNPSYADVLPQYYKFTIDEHCSIQNVPNQYFVYTSGVGLFRGVNGVDDDTECMYVHIQKRPMHVRISEKGIIPSKLYIQENYFDVEHRSTHVSALQDLRWRLNYMRRQLKKLDWSHIKIHLKTRTIRKDLEW